MRQIELLAPARNLECGIAAIDHGADAVYIGAPRFGARSAAGNSVDDIRSLCAYAHQFGVRVYVTVNTIIYEDELNETYRLLEQLSDAGTDAVLVQDMAVLDYLVAHPELQMAIHASTQTDNRTAEKVQWLLAQGASRVVLARELSVSEIAEIHRKQPEAELEVFVHGALCVSYSGLCYASQKCFGRSANRGECAQFCRMKFDLLDASGTEIEHQRYLLSLKDLNQSQRLRELIEAGATSLKIEGRLKDVAYVKNVTAAYSEALNRVISQSPDRYQRASRGRCSYTFFPNLSKSFNRGYTSYFAVGRQPGIACFDTPKATGEFVGTVKSIRGNKVVVAGVSSFANGDGLCFVNEQRELEGFRVNRVEGNMLVLQRVPSTLHVGARLYRNSDQEFQRILSKPSAVRKIPVCMGFRATEKGFLLQMEDAIVEQSMPHEVAKTPQRDNVFRQLTKLGGTPYECSHLDIDEDFPFFVPSSKLAEMRRMAVEKLTASAGRKLQSSGAEQREPVLLPRYSMTYQHNISNPIAADFYRRQGLTSYSPAFEVKPPSGSVPLMQCRHCLRYALGACVKNGGRPPKWREPLFLRLGDGRRFRLEFDCKKCQMNVYAEDC